MKITLSRDVTKAEYPFLYRDYKAGETLYTYDGCTYGCISGSGTACTDVDGETPFFEIPNDAITPVSLLQGLSDAMGTLIERMMRIEVRKLENLTDCDHPNNINVGYTREGMIVQVPTVGETFYVNRVGGVFYTSKVTEILEESEAGGKFRTENSIYQWRVLADEKEEKETSQEG